MIIKRTNFAFLGQGWSGLLANCRSAEYAAYSNPRLTGIEARVVLEKIVGHICATHTIQVGDRWNLNDKMTHHAFVDVVGHEILNKMHIIRRHGNTAAHGPQDLTVDQAVRVVKQLWDITTWASARYTNLKIENIPPFDESILVSAPQQEALSNADVQKILKQHEREADQAREKLRATELLFTEAQENWLKQQEEHTRQVELFKQNADEEKQALEAEIEKLRAQIAQQARAVNTSAHYAISEAETRKDLIDPMLADAGFSKTQGNLIEEYRVAGMPTNENGDGYIDYLLLDGNGTPLAVVEAKRTSRSVDDGRQQAQLYADCIEKEYGVRPLIYYTNGYEIRLWDDASGYQPRAVEGYATATDLYGMIRRRTTRHDLGTAPIDAAIAGRTYQQKMLRAVAERFEARHRRALLVMATGTGKTRTAIALVKMLQEAGWVKKVLFLADRKSLVKQAADAFTEHMSNTPVVNLLKNPRGIGQVYCCTYQTMIDMLDTNASREGKFYPYSFDLIIVDEAHRTIYQRYSRIFDFFDSLILGLTATPRQQVDRNTYAMFHLEDGHPTGDYGMSEAISDGYLVPFEAFNCGSVILRHGVSYDELTEEEKIAWELQDWGTDENGEPLEAPEEARAAEINARLYNLDTIRKVVAQVLSHGIKTKGGDTIGKTIFFTRNKRHAELVHDELIKADPNLSAAIITHDAKDALMLIDDFKGHTNRNLDVAVSVDMLDTGIDVPEVVNLVFFRPVFSHTKFWQMIGRGTRLAPNLFGEGLDKKYFYIFDYCENLKYFEGTEGIATTEGSAQKSLSERTFLKRLALIEALDVDSNFRSSVEAKMRSQLQSVPDASALVSPRDREPLERCRQPEPWNPPISAETSQQLESLAHLPFAAEPEDEENAKRFDYLVLSMQVQIVYGEPLKEKYCQRIQRIATNLLTKTNVPQIAAVAETLEHYTQETWWETATLETLELLRREVRVLAKFVDRNQRKAVVMDIEDELGGIEPLSTALIVEEKLHSDYSTRVRKVIENNLDTLAVQKLRKALPMTADDISSLEYLLAEAGVGDLQEFRKEIGEESVLLFIRKLVGLEKKAMWDRFADLLQDSTLTAMQLEFLKKIVEVLSSNGLLETRELFEPPFDQYGTPLDLFDGKTALVREIDQRLRMINDSAAS